MSAPRSQDEDESFLPFNDFDLYFQLEPELNAGRAGPGIFPGTDVHAQTGQLDLSALQHDHEPGTPSAIQDPMTGISAPPPSFGNFDYGTSGTLGPQEFFRPPRAYVPTQGNVGQLVDYGSSGIAPMRPVPQPNSSTILDNYTSFSSTIGSQPPVDPSARAPHSPLVVGAYSNMVHQSIPPPEIPAITPTTPGPSTSSTSTRKRKAFGPANRVVLRPPKRGGRFGPMSREECKERQRMRQEGACIRCRSRKKKCDGNTPCATCQGSSIKSNPCVKAHFLDIVEEKPCYPFSAFYESIILGTCDNRSYLERFVVAGNLYCQGVILKVETDEPFPLTLFSSWSHIVKPLLSDPESKVAMEEISNKGLDGFPNLRSVITKAPNQLSKTGGRGVPGFAFNPSGDSRTLQQVLLCSAIRHKFTLIDAENQCSPPPGSPAHASAELLLWLLIRQCEILLFRHLQNSVNRLSSLSNPDLESIVHSLLLAIGPLKASFKGCARVFSPDKNVSVDPEMVRELEDRQKRLRMALFIYADIACSKLQAYQNFWKGLEQSPLKFSQSEFRKLLKDIDSFESKIQARANEGLINPNSERGICREGVDAREVTNSFPGACRSPHPLFDSTGGQQNLPTDETSNPLPNLISRIPAETRAWKFFVVAKIDWVQAFSSISIPETQIGPSDIGLFFLAKELSVRMSLVEGCMLAKSGIAGSGVSAAHFIHDLRVSAAIRASKERISSKKILRRGLLRLREGLRWIELQEIAGEEIHLVIHPRGHSGIGNEAHYLDIPSAVTKGSEAEFDRLKKLLLTSESWVIETCRLLKGLVSMICEALEKVDDDKNAALSLAHQIQRRVFQVFGNRDRALDCRISSCFESLVGRLSRGDPDTLQARLRETWPVGTGQDTDGTSFRGSEGREPDEEELTALARSTEAILERFLKSQEPEG